MCTNDKYDLYQGSPKMFGRDPILFFSGIKFETYFSKFYLTKTNTHKIIYTCIIISQIKVIKKIFSNNAIVIFWLQSLVDIWREKSTIY